MSNSWEQNPGSPGAMARKENHFLYFVSLMSCEKHVTKTPAHN